MGAAARRHEAKGSTCMLSGPLRVWLDEDELPDDERGFLAQQRTRVRGVLGRDEKGGTPRRRGLERGGACGVCVPPLVIPSTCHCLLRR